MLTITEYSSITNKEHVLAQIRNCDWAAAKFLAVLLEENRMESVLGGWAKLFLLIDGERLVSFVTLSCQDCVDDKSLTPWFGFLFTVPCHRGKGYAPTLLRHALKAARQMGYSVAYLATDHEGLYEKYGFTYLQTRTDIYNERSRVYTYNLLTI